MSIALPPEAKVRFTQERLAILTPRDRQGLAGRIGVIQSDSRSVGKPTVYFPASGNKPELRLFRVDPRHLELVEGPPHPTVTPSDIQPTAPRNDEKLSQSDLDNFFD